MVKIGIIAVGKCRDRAILELIERYRARLPVKADIIEITPSKEKSASRTIDDEAARLDHAAKPYGCRLVLDERGKSMSSAGFADWWRGRIDQGRGDLAVLIGGAEGIAASIRDDADLVMGFGRQTWPHMMVRAMIMEQLYRADTIMRGHPYHRE